MKTVLDVMKNVLTFGYWQNNRTGVRTISLPGQVMRFDLQHGFPAVTTRKLPFKTSAAEMCAFFRAERSAAGFRELGCKVWDQNANENEQWLNNPYREGHDDLGGIYGFQWRKWPAYKQIKASKVAQLNDALGKGYEEIGSRVVNGEKVLILFKEIDQVRECLDKIINNPSDRRILFHAWNPAELDAMGLPPCHLLYSFQCNVEAKELSITIFIRSNDLGLGNPLNIAEGALMVSLFGRLTGYTPRFLTVMIADAHIYENHVDMVAEQMKREPKDLPVLKISDRIPDYAKTGVYDPEWLDKILPEDFSLEGYEHHPAITAPMAV